MCVCVSHHGIGSTATTVAAKGFAMELSSEAQEWACLVKVAFSAECERLRDEDDVEWGGMDIPVGLPQGRRVGGPYRCSDIDSRYCDIVLRWQKCVIPFYNNFIRKRSKVALRGWQKLHRGGLCLTTRSKHTLESLQREREREPSHRTSLRTKSKQVY